MLFLYIIIEASWIYCFLSKNIFYKDKNKALSRQRKQLKLMEIQKKFSYDENAQIYEAENENFKNIFYENNKK